MTNKISILALGDSYTLGEGVPMEDSFPHQLSVALTNSGYSPFIQVVAKTGWTSGDLLKAMEDQEYLSSYSFVLLLIGVNNQYRGLSLENYKGEFKILLEKAIAFSRNPKRTIVISIPDWGLTPFGKESGRENISAEIDLFNMVNRNFASEFGCYYIDITAVSRKVEAEKDFLAPDNLHYSSKFYQFIVKNSMDYIMQIKN